jgi:predicted nucleic acid-binding protein
MAAAPERLYTRVVVANVNARLVLDSSVLVAAMKPSEPGHADAADLLERLRRARALAEVELFAPPELWLEARVAAQKAEKSATGPTLPDVGALLRGLDVELVPMTSVDEIDAFFERLGRHARDRAPFANATDLVYLWVAWRSGAALVTLDRGLLKYHGMVCDVVRPFHVRLP